MEFHDIFRFSHITVNRNGHPTYNDCIFLRSFGNWKKGDNMVALHTYGNLFLYISSNTNNKGQPFFEECALLSNIDGHEKGTFIDVIACLTNICMWIGDELIGDETLTI